MADKGNMFAEAAKKRALEQQDVEDVLKGSDGKKDERRTTMTISMTVAQKTRLKVYAAKAGTTVAALVQEWIETLGAPGGFQK